MAQDAPSLFQALLAAYGRQGWWPMITRRHTPGYDAEGHHLDGTFVPRDRIGRFEIFCGAILTQNTSWRNVALVLENLHGHGLLEPNRLAELDEVELAGLIRSAGYHNQKARKLLIAARAGLAAGWFETADNAPNRETLLSIWGIGPETADCLLLYIWGVPSFVVDAYTRRLLSRLGWDFGFDPITAGYGAIREWFMLQLTGSALVAAYSSGNLASLFNEYHALIVRHGKEHCAARPKCQGCFLAADCSGNLIDLTGISP